MSVRGKAILIQIALFVSLQLAAVLTFTYKSWLPLLVWLSILLLANFYLRCPKCG